MGGGGKERKRSYSGLGSFLERVKNFIRGPFLFSVCEYTSFRLSGRKGGGVRWHEAWELALGLHARPSACLLASRFFGRGLRHGVFCRKALTAGWWMTNEVAFSGAAKLRLSRGRLERGALAGGSPARRPRATVPLAGPGAALSRWNHAFASLAVGHGPPVMVGSGGLAGFLLPAFLHRLSALPVAPGAAGHRRGAVVPVPEAGTTQPQKNPSAGGEGPDRKGKGLLLSSEVPRRGHQAWARTPPCQLQVGGEREFVTRWLSDLWQITKHVWASVSSSIK